MHTIRRVPIDNSSPPAFRYEVVYQTGAAKDAFTMFDCENLQQAFVICQALNGGANPSTIMMLDTVRQVFN